MVSAQAAIGDVVAAARARALHRAVRRRVRRLERRRAADRRLLHDAPVVALDLLRQPAARHRRARRAGGHAAVACTERAQPRDRLRRHGAAGGRAQRDRPADHARRQHRTPGARRRSSAWASLGGRRLVALRRSSSGARPSRSCPPSLFRNRVFVVTSAVGFVVGFALFGALTYLPLFQQVVRGLSPTASGLQLLPVMGGAADRLDRLGADHHAAPGATRCSRSPAPRSPRSGMFLLSLAGRATRRPAWRRCTCSCSASGSGWSCRCSCSRCRTRCPTRSSAWPPRARRCSARSAARSAPRCSARSSPTGSTSELPPAAARGGAAGSTRRRSSTCRPAQRDVYIAAFTDALQLVFLGRGGRRRSSRSCSRG